MLSLLFALVLATTATPEIVAEPLPKLYGTVETPGDKLASLVPAGGNAAMWVAEGSRVGAFVLKTVARGKITLARSDGTTVEVFLEGSQPSGVRDDRPAPFSRKWINSHANPMLHRPMEFGPTLSRAWSTMSKKEREAVFAYYLNHGWQIVRIESYGAGLTIEWENVYTEERKKVVNENRDRFVASLNESQRELWNELNMPGGTVRVRLDGMTEEQKRELERRKALSARFRASLKPDQEAERASIEDFTKGKW